MNEKSYETFLICDAAYKTQYGVNPLRIIFDKVDRYTIIYDGTKYLTLFHSDEKYESVFDGIKYLIMSKSIISDVYFHKYSNIKVNSDNDLLLEKIFNIQNVVMLMKSAFNKNHNHYKYQTFLEKC